MLEVARQRQIYDQLVCGELIEFLQTRAQGMAQDMAGDEARVFDVALAADVLVYLGDLSGLFDEVARVAARGVFRFFGRSRREPGFRAEINAALRALGRLSAPVGAPAWVRGRDHRL
jgi:predicted TPR repeat methyltransferase